MQKVGFGTFETEKNIINVATIKYQVFKKGVACIMDVFLLPKTQEKTSTAWCKAGPHRCSLNLSEYVIRKIHY